MFKPSALNTTVASAAESVDNYTGTIADLVGELENMTVAIEVVQTGSQVTYDYTFSGAFVTTPGEGSPKPAAISLCHPTAADAYNCVYMKTR